MSREMQGIFSPSTLCRHKKTLVVLYAVLIKGNHELTEGNMAVREGFESLQHNKNSIYFNKLKKLEKLKCVHLGC